MACVMVKTDWWFSTIKLPKEGKIFAKFGGIYSMEIVNQETDCEPLIEYWLKRHVALYNDDLIVFVWVLI